jgi:copper transport protein
LGKVGLVAVMLALGALGRQLVMSRMPAGAADPSAVAQTLRRSVFVESAVALIVLAVTAALVATPPARTTFTQPNSEIVALDDGLALQVDVEPLRVGENQTHVYFTGEGSKAVNVEEVSARFVHLEGGDVVPVEVNYASLGHYEAKSIVLPFPGQWRLELLTRTSDINAETSVFTIRVR